MMLNFGEMTHSHLRSKREFAHFGQTCLRLFVSKFSTGNLCLVGRESSNSNSPYCQHRYPSPCRPVLFSNRPTPPSNLVAADCGSFGLQPLAFLSKRNNSRTIEKTKESRQECLRKLGSSQPQQPSAWLAALTRMQNVLSSVRAQAQSLRISLAQIVLGQPSSVPQQASSATTQASAANKKFLPSWAHKPINRRGDITPAAVLRSKDPLHV